MISKSFIKSSFIYTVVGSLPLASSILLLPFYGNSSLLSTSDFGLLAIYIILSELARILFTFSADNFLGINYIHYNTDKNTLQRFIGTSTIFILLYGLAMVLLFSALGNSIINILYSEKSINYYPFGFISIITGFFNGVFKSYTTLLVFREKPRPYFWSNLIHFIAVIGISVSGLYLLPLSLNGPIWGRFIGALITFIWAVVYLTNESKLKYDSSILKRLLHYSAPLYIYSILYWVVANIDRYFILGLMSESYVAIFDFAIKMTLVIEFLQNGLSSAINPKVFKIWKENGDNPQGDININKYFHVFALINIFSVPILYLSIPLLVPIVVNNQDLYQSFNLLPVLFAGMIVRVWYYYLIAPIFYFKKTKILPIVFSVSALFQILTTYFGLKYFNIEGAVWANFLTKILQVVLLSVFVTRFYMFRVNAKKFILFPALYILLLLVSEILFKHVNLYLINILHLIILTILGYYIFRKEIRVSQIVKIFKQ
ncbi:MAG: oligosaccharide flippase family protein [Bacteroidales bacterium]|nr:MAG: oligosaccharide flippase family protein [Bacteroidales bacterium]